MKMSQVEMIWRQRKMAVLVWITFVLLCNGPVAQARRRVTDSSPSYSYVCPPNFMRLGSSCYYFSTELATWQNAHFACLDRQSNLTAPQRWEDRNMREFLNRPEIDRAERWLGGAYDWEARVWKWAGEARDMHYQSFSRMPRRDPDQLKWHCIAMDPQLLYRWTPRSCLEQHLYICQTSLRKMRQSELGRLTQNYGQKSNDSNQTSVSDFDNEIVANRAEQRTGPYAVPVGRESNMTPRPLQQKPDGNEFAYRPSPGVNKGKKRFPGYQYNKKDPEAAYRHNVKLLKSGKTGLSQAQVERHLRRLERIRKARLVRNKRLHNVAKNITRRRDDDDWLSNSIPRNGQNRRGGHKSRSMDRVTHRTYLVDNKISPLHPKTIVEVHEFSTENRNQIV